MRLLYCILVLLLWICTPLMAHPDSEVLPKCAGAVTFLVPEKLSDAHFFPDEKNLTKKIQDTQARLAKNKLSVKIESIAVFQNGFLLHSNATPATVRYILKYKVLSDQLVWEEKKNEKNQPEFSVKNAAGDTFLITFPKEQYTLVLSPLSEKVEQNFDCKNLLKDIPDDIVLAFLWPNPGNTPEYPLMSELKSVSLSVKYLKGEARPVYAEVIMPARSEEASAKVTTACKAFFEKVYADASKLGKIPKEMVNAFTVSSTKNTTTIHVSLTDENAGTFLSLFLANLNNAVAPLELPDKFK